MGEENVQMTLDFLEPSAIELKVDPFMRVKLYNSATQETHEDIEFKMMFPLSNKNGFLVLYHEDREIGVIRDYRELKNDSRKVIEDILGKHYFVPVITQVLNVTEKYRLVHWDVETDRGKLDFYTRTRNDVVVKDNEVYIRDIDSNRYLIKDHTKLSPQSQRELSSEI